MEEQRLVENALTELRFRFVQAMESQKKAADEASPKPKAEASAEARKSRPASKWLQSRLSDHGARIGHQRGRADDRLPLRGVPFRPIRATSACGLPSTCDIGDRGVLIDTTPDFRYQALRSDIERVDAILFTHSHADHVMGLDDVRPFNYRQGGVIPIYGVGGHHRAHPADVPLHFRRSATRESSRPRLVDARFRRRAHRSVRAGVPAHPAEAWQRHGVWVPLRRCGVFDGSQRDSRGVHGAAARPGRVVSGCAAPQAASDAFDGGAVAGIGGEAGAAARVFHAHLPRPGARLHRGAFAAARAAGLRRAGNRSSGRRAPHDLSQPGGNARRFRAVRHHHRQFRRRARGHRQDSAAGGCARRARKVGRRPC